MPAELDPGAVRRLGDALSSAGRALVAAGYNERSVCAWYGAGLVSDARYLSPPPSRSRRGLGGAIALFVAGEEIERKALPFLDEPQLDALCAAGLLSRHGSSLRARVSVVPILGVLVAADRLDDASPKAVLSPDVSAWNLAASLPARPASLLDVGCGAGCAALVAARSGARVLGSDVDGRALAFACLNAGLNHLPAIFVEGDLFAGIDDRFEVVCFNAPLVRAPLVDDASPLYLRSPRGESLAAEFLVGARARTLRNTDAGAGASGEVLCHVQLTPAIEEAMSGAGYERSLALHFADAVDGTPHSLVSLRDAAPSSVAVGYRARVRVPLGPALPHLRREPLDRLHATRELWTLGEGALREAVLRPPPWLLLAHSSIHDGVGFRSRELRFGAHRMEPDELALLDACDGRPLGEVVRSDEGMARALSLIERGLLVA